MPVTPMPDLPISDYRAIRSEIRAGDVVFFSQDTRGVKKVTQFVSWRIKCDQTPPHQCTHVGLLDWVHERCVVIEATSPRVRVSPLSMFVCETEGPDGKRVAPYDGTVHVGRFEGCESFDAVCAAWDNLLLPYDFLDLAAIRLGIKRSNTRQYICSELVAEALRAGGVALKRPANGWIPTPADLALSAHMLWRLR